jgi:eukaryotic-like serine/threonine-protein kinase
MQPERLGPYRIERKLGRGGMGTVFAGIDDLGHRVAVKMLSPALATEPGFRQRFDAEIESLKKLMHPGIVRLYGFGEQDDYIFYSMEFIDGPSLEDELRAGRRFDWRETATLAIQIARALRHAHDHGVIHRDLKPANLLLAGDEQIKLSDFGIARLFGQRLTGSGGVLGTAEYMAPEQAEGQPVSPRCDLYSLGCVMYAMLTGQPPFRADSLPAMLDKHRRESPRPLRDLAADVPEGLERIVMRLLSKLPDERFPTAQSVARELEMLVDRLTLGSSKAQPATPPATHDRSSYASRAESPRAVLADTDVEGPSSSDRSNANFGPLPATGESGTMVDATAGPRRVRFEKVDTAGAHQTSGKWWHVALAALPTAILLAALIALIAYLVRSPSIDERFAAIEAAAAVDDPAVLADQEREIDRLIDDLDDDDMRLDVLRDYQAAIELWRIERRLARGLPTARRNGGRTPVERLLADALRMAESNPAQAVRLLETILALENGPTNDGTNGTESSRHAIATARRNLERLRPLVERQRADHRALIEASLERAKSLESSDPAAARRIHEALVRQYGEEAWTAELIEPARAALKGATDE